MNSVVVILNNLARLLLANHTSTQDVYHYFPDYDYSEYDYSEYDYSEYEDSVFYGLLMN